MRLAQPSRKASFLGAAWLWLARVRSSPSSVPRMTSSDSVSRSSARRCNGPLRQIAVNAGEDGAVPAGGSLDSAAPTVAGAIELVQGHNEIVTFSSEDQLASNRGPGLGASSVQLT